MTRSLRHKVSECNIDLFSFIRYLGYEPVPSSAGTRAHVRLIVFLLTALHTSFAMVVVGGGNTGTIFFCLFCINVCLKSSQPSNHAAPTWVVGSEEECLGVVGQYVTVIDRSDRVTDRCILKIDEQIRARRVNMAWLKCFCFVSFNCLAICFRHSVVDIDPEKESTKRLSTCRHQTIRILSVRCRAQLHRQ